MTSSVMQRLHNVRQLGLAHLVYPGANYSRFSHSVGACHNASNLVEAVRRNSKLEISNELAQQYRIVALLHDIGHYPFSHAMEHVVGEYYAKQLVAAADGSEPPKASGVLAPIEGEFKQVVSSPPSYHHEPLGEQIIRRSPELSAIFKKYGIDPAGIADRFSKSIPDGLIGIISSDLDCDRLDYLRRTAQSSGAPFGSVDIRFLIDHATADTSGTFCFLPKAARAADHLLVSRYFDYMQIPYNKTVAALEWSLVTGIRALLEASLINCSGTNVELMIDDGSWSHFDDQKLMEKFRDLYRSIEGNQAKTVLGRHLSAILDRRPAKLIAGWDELMPRIGSTSSKNEFIAKKLKDEVAEEFSIDPERLHVWTSPVLFSKADGSIDAGNLSEEVTAEAVQILDPATGTAKLLVHRPDALVSKLSVMKMSGLRLYHLPGDEIDEEILGKIIARFADALGQPTSTR